MLQVHGIYFLRMPNSLCCNAATKASGVVRRTVSTGAFKALNPVRYALVSKNASNRACRNLISAGTKESHSARNALCSTTAKNASHFVCRTLSSAATKETNPVILTSRSCTVYLLGTMHIAEASAVAVRKLIEREHASGKLASIFLELDEDRYNRLRRTPAAPPDEFLLQHALSILSRPGRTPLASLFELVLSTIYRALHKLGFASGAEFREAIHTADRLGHIPLVLGDQDIKITLARISEGLPRDFSIAKVLQLLSAPSAGGIEGKIERDLREVFQEMANGNFEMGQKKLERLIDRDTARKLVVPMRNFAPAMTAAILDERDSVMAANLLAEAHKHPGKSIVAAVGMAHLDGIVSRWNIIAT